MAERRALDYFQAALWPLFTTSTNPCPPPISLAMEYQPVLLTICELAESHRALRDKCPPTGGKVSLKGNKRLSCLASIREQLRHGASSNESLSRLLVAVLLLYFLDGFIECAHQSAATASHQAGVRAIIEHLGGFTALIDMDQRDTNMLLSEFASTDLTRALIDDRPPCFSADIWLRIDRGTVWWEKQKYNGTDLALVFRTMAQMSFYRQALKRGDETEVSIESVQEFERCLQPTYLTLNLDHVASPDTYTVRESHLEPEIQAVAFTRAFQHSALIYLYRAICGLPPRHCLVQQHVQSCIESVKTINRSSKAHNCIIFPLYVMGAHAFTADAQAFVLEKLDAVYRCIRFDSVISIRAVLGELWGSPRHDGDWSDMFTSLSRDVLVL